MLQTLGVRPGRVFRIVIAESLILCVAGGLAGTVAALVVLSFSGMAVGAEGVTIAFRPSARLAATGAVVSLGVGLIAGIIPAWQAARTEIVLALRQA